MGGNQPADGTIGLQTHDHRRAHGGRAGRGQGIDGAGACRLDPADRDEGRADGRRPEMGRRAAVREVVGRIVLKN